MSIDFRSLARRMASSNIEAAKKKSKKSKKSKVSKPKKVKKVPLDLEPEEEVMTDDMLEPKTEYSCQLQLSITADFEGEVDKNKLLRKLKNETINAIKTSVGITATEYGLDATKITVQPINVECATNSIE